MKPRNSTRYEVGYGKPPVARQFKPGQSGNPRGRPKKNQSVVELLEAEFTRSRTIVEDGKRLRVRTDIILIKRMVDLALNGNMRALKMTMALIEHVREMARSRQDLDPDASIEEYREEFKRLREAGIREAAISNQIKKDFL